MKQAICVLGMHRSGTSMLTRILNLMGVYIGKEEDVLAFGEDNTEGFWEHRGIVSIQERILDALSRKWYSLTPLPDEWLEDPQVQVLKRELIDLIIREFSDVSLWAWKDPRTCLLLPLWNQVFQELQIDVKYIIPVRNPLDVANSLFVRNKMKQSYGLTLWYHYMINILHYTKDDGKLILDYDSILEEPMVSINRISKFIGLDLKPEIEGKILESVKPVLRHSNSSNIELSMYADNAIVSLYNNFKNLKHLSDDEPYRIDVYNTHAKLFGINEMSFDIDSLQGKLKQQTQELEQRTQELNRKSYELVKTEQELKQRTQELNRKSNELAKTEEEISQLKDIILEKNNLVDDLKQKSEDTINSLRELARNNLSVVNRTKAQAIKLSSTKLFKLVHLAYRIKNQLIKGRISDKREFCNWMLKRSNKNVCIGDHSYNPMYQIVNLLDQNKVDDLKAFNSLTARSDSHDLVKSQIAVTTLKKDIDVKVDLKGKYNKYDVIFLSVIDYDFRYQRPQHIAAEFARNGHRVFYINANFNRLTDSTTMLCPDLMVFSLKSNSFNQIYDIDDCSKMGDICTELEKIVDENAVRDCVVIVEYPTWIVPAQSLKFKYGFKVLTDYLDDYTGFKDTSNHYLPDANVELLKLSDGVISSSTYLLEIAQKHNQKVELVRNGTEFEHFNKAFKKPQINKIRKNIIGYYGAVAHWFDFEKIEYVAENLRDAEIVIIGHVTEGYEKLKRHSNIKLLGEKPYEELPNYLKGFDVCLIPFDTSTELIKATNPVKFYEYLSAGKKIVATEIPELMQFKDKYAYLANGNTDFLRYIKLCLENQDDLLSEEECIAFARENDWFNRGQAFQRFADSTFEKVSIIMLTYNQIEYTKKCIDSIVDKTAYSNYELIIVDNMSSDGTREYLKCIDEQYSQIKVILNEENKGFAAGNNIGISNATGDFYILLNNDTIVTRGWITGLLKHFKNNPRLGLIGPVTNNIGNESKINTSYKSLDDMDEFAFVYTSKAMGEMYKEIRTLAMFCIVIPKFIFNKVGFLDENFKVGMFEDDDYSYAVSQLGYEISCAEDVFVHHFGSVSFKKIQDKKYKEIFERNKDYFETKWGTTWLPHKYRDGIL